MGPVVVFSDPRYIFHFVDTFTQIVVQKPPVSAYILTAAAPSRDRLEWKPGRSGGAVVSGYFVV